MIPLPSQIKIVKKENNKTFFEVAGLYPGYGITLGNSLRRVLLSSLEGAAITQVKIKGVAHEFSTVPGVLEDVVRILINLKKLRFKTFTEEPQTVELSVKGEKKVKAKDFKLSAQVKLINPESPVATLTKSSAHLQIEAKIEKGVGYQPIERREVDKAEVRALPLDAIFTPVVKVNFSVENMRVGKRTDFDKLNLEIETDGSISPQEALENSAQLLSQHFTLVAEGVAQKPQAKEAPSKETAKKAKKGRKEAPSSEVDVKKMNIEELAVSERVKNVLLNSNIKTIGGLMRKSADSLAKTEGLGGKGLEEITKALAKLNISLK